MGEVLAAIITWFIGALTKILISFIMALIYFVMTPRARDWRHVVVMMLSSIVVGLLVHLYSQDGTITNTLAHVVSAFFGLVSFRLMTVMVGLIDDPDLVSDFKKILVDYARKRLGLESKHGE